MDTCRHVGLVHPGLNDAILGAGHHVGLHVAMLDLWQWSRDGRHVVGLGRHVGLVVTVLDFRLPCKTSGGNVKCWSPQQGPGERQARLA